MARDLSYLCIGLSAQADLQMPDSLALCLWVWIGQRVFELWFEESGKDWDDFRAQLREFDWQGTQRQRLVQQWCGRSVEIICDDV